MAASELTEKERQNDVFAVEVNRTSRFHTALSIYRLAHQRLKNFKWTSENNKKFLEACLAVFALKQIQ